MGPLACGVVVDDLGAGVRAGILRAATLGFDCVQLSCVHGELQLGSLSESARRGLRKFIADRGLCLSAISAAYPQGLRDPDANDRIVPAVCTFIRNARDVGATIVTVRPGRVLSLASGDRGTRAVREALVDLTTCADAHGVLLAADVMTADAVHLHGLLMSVASEALGANLDPGLVKADGGSALAAARLFGAIVQHVQVRQCGGTTTLYDDIPWNECVAALRDAGYCGCLSLARRPTAARIEAIEERVATLRAMAGGVPAAPPPEKTGTGEIQVPT